MTVTLPRYTNELLDMVAEGALTPSEAVAMKVAAGHTREAFSEYSPRAAGVSQAASHAFFAMIECWPAEPVATPVPEVHDDVVLRFTCRRCGEHHDTVVRGHCDDCEAQ